MSEVEASAKEMGPEPAKPGAGPSVQSQPDGRRQRRLRNLLLDRHFQLKYAGYLVALSLLLSASLGTLLWSTSHRLLEQSRQNVESGARIVSLGNEVLAESQKVSTVVRLNIVKDPVYQHNPDLLEAFNLDSEQQDARLHQQAQRLTAEREALAVQAKRLDIEHRQMLLSLVGLLSLLVIGSGRAGIVVTHKVAGPIFKMRRHLREVGLGRLDIPHGLRKGDELGDFFADLRDMVVALREQRQDLVWALQREVNELSRDLPEERLRRLRRLLEEQAAPLGSSRQAPTDAQ